MEGVLTAKRPHARVLAALLLAAIAFVVQGDAPAHASQREATPPYDFGCLGEPPCKPDWDLARDGTLLSVKHPGVCWSGFIIWIPVPCMVTTTSSAGLVFDNRATGLRTVTMTARVRLIDHDPGAGIGPAACLRFTWAGDPSPVYAPSPWGWGGPSGCVSLAPGQVATITRSDEIQNPGRFLIWVNAQSGTGALFVESISYTVTSTVQPPPPPSSDCTITGTSSADTLTGTSGADVICGLGGNDTISGLGGADVLRGGDGNDTLTGGAGNDSIDGGAGTDTASYSGSSGGVTANLSAGAPQVSSDGTGGSDTLSGIESLTGSSTGSDSITGSSGANVLDGLGGNDNLYGLSGNDTLRGGSGTDRLDGGDGTDKCVDKDSNTTRVSCEG